MNIIRMDCDRLEEMNRANEPFDIIGRIVPTFIDGRWSYAEEIFGSTSTKIYPTEHTDYTSYIDNEDKAVFLAYDKGEYVGKLVLCRDWNGYALVEDIAVAKSHRGRGIGSALMERAVDWAKAADLCGLALETQDNNLLACRFYAKLGFTIGGVNTMLYKNFAQPIADELAIFWYLTF